MGNCMEANDFLINTLMILCSPALKLWAVSCPKNWVACDQKMLPFLALRASFAAPWDEFFFRKMYHANIITDFYGETEQLHALDCSMHLELCHCARSRAADNKRKKGNYKSLPWIGKLLRQLYWKIHYLSCLVYFLLCLIITSFRVELARKIEKELYFCQVQISRVFLKNRNCTLKTCSHA